ncbi:MAG TPA: DNA-directed RNA polymerase subunit beta', partial [bacterium]|nr:DNA-directed RNA polymerase subunit beta' [bacterium]
TKEDSQAIGTTVVARLQGRWTLDDIKDPKTGKVVIKADTFVTKELVNEYKDLDLESARIRSVVTCKLRRGVCAKCYGSDLTKHQPVELGTAVGIMAAQSIGEPGTQLTMRTFHSGGVAGSDITQGLPRVEELFEVRSPKHKAFLAEAEGVARVMSGEEMVKTTKSNAKLLGSNYKQKIVQIAYEADDKDTYMLPSEGKILVAKGDVVKKGSALYEDSTGSVVKAKSAGQVVTFTKAKLEIASKVNSVLEYVIPPNYVLWVKDGQKVEKGQQLTDGVLDLQQLYLLKGREAVQNYMISEVQNIYASQGQKLNDKHLEIVIRQLFSRVMIVDAGDTDLLPGEIAEKAEVVYQNNLVVKQGGREATYQELLLGISKVSLSSSSFLAAASFQETSKVLINAALTGKIDRLEGLKENIIIGRLIPAGTGFQKKGEGFMDLVEKYGPAPLGMDEETWRATHAPTEEAGLDAKATD